MTKLAIFASGTGSNFRTIYQKIREGYLSGQLAVLITDNPKAGSATFAEENNIPLSIVKPRDFPTSQAFGQTLLQVLREQETTFIVLAGYLKKIPDNVIEKYQNRIINIHPALLPAFGGKGMYGIRVHQAVFQSGVKVSGVTVHLVNKEYDAGPIVLQKTINITGCQSPQEIADKVLALEHIALPEALKLLLENDYTVDGQRVTIRKVLNDQN